MEILLLLALGVHLTAADTHTYQSFFTAVTPGINFPEFTVVGLLDGVQFEYYDSSIRKLIPKTEWMERNEAADYWDTNTQGGQDQEEHFKRNMDIVMQRFNQTEGVHTVQMMFGCELDDDGSTRGYKQDGYDGEDFLSLDLKTLTWIAPTPQALITKNKWDQTGAAANQWKNFLENTCIEELKKYVSYGRETLERKVHPEVSVFQKHSSPSLEVVCHATGFFPKAVVITWQKDGEDVHEDVELRKTLHNQDGSFQKRSILRVPAEELQKHNYTCVVQHSSLGDERIVKEVPKGGGSIGVILGVIAALVILAALAGCVGFLVRRKTSGERNKAFEPVPQNSSPSTDDDSSSNNSNNKV